MRPESGPGFVSFVLDLFQRDIMWSIRILRIQEVLVWDCVMKFSKKKKKINIAGNPLMVRLRRCQLKAGTLRRHSYGNSLLSPAVAGGSDYVSTLIGYWCPINDTLTQAYTCTHALESARTPLHACTLSRQLEDKISVTKCLFLYTFII